MTDEAADPVRAVEWVVPPVEAVQYGRRVVEAVREQYRSFERAALANGNTDSARRFRAVHTALTRELLGHEDGGCVIVPFDARWLDEPFRALMAKVRASIPEQDR